MAGIRSMHACGDRLIGQVWRGEVKTTTINNSPLNLPPLPLPPISLTRHAYTFPSISFLSTFSPPHSLILILAPLSLSPTETTPGWTAHPPGRDSTTPHPLRPHRAAAYANPSAGHYARSNRHLQPSPARVASPPLPPTCPQLSPAPHPRPAQKARGGQSAPRVTGPMPFHRPGTRPWASTRVRRAWLLRQWKEDRRKSKSKSRTRRGRSTTRPCRCRRARSRPPHRG